MRRLRKSGPADRCRGAGEQGAVLAEFALVLPVLLMIVFGIIEFGVLYSRSQAVTAAAREAARLASLSTTDAAEVAARVDATLGGIPFDSPPQVSVDPSVGCLGRQGQSVTVTVDAPHRLTVPFVVDRQVTLTGRALFRCEA